VWKDGRVDQFVREADAAWAVGIDLSLGAEHWGSDLTMPWLADCYAKGVNPNLPTISVETEGWWYEPWTEAQYAAIVDLTRDVARRHAWGKEWWRLFGHWQVNRRDKTYCPGPLAEWNHLMADWLR